jgi:restriction system protein
VRAMLVAEREARKETEGQGESEIVEAEETSEVASWREKLLTRLLTMPPASFERLCMRVLRESGFIQVEVTGRTGDGGIDGFGVARLVGMLSFRVSFQCKRYRGNVSASVVRDFRGAMMGARRRASSSRRAGSRATHVRRPPATARPPST